MKLATYTMLMFMAFCHMVSGMDQAVSSIINDELSLTAQLRNHIFRYNQGGDLKSLSVATLFSKALALEGNKDARLLNNYLNTAVFLKYLSKNTLENLYSTCQVITEEQHYESSNETESFTFYALNDRALDVLIRDISVTVLVAEEKKLIPADFMFDYYMGIKNQISPEFLSNIGCPNFPSVEEIKLAIPKFF